jgi:hypothetical protein
VEEENGGRKFRFVECHRRRQGRESWKKIWAKNNGRIGGGFAILWVEMATWKFVFLFVKKPVGTLGKKRMAATAKDHKFWAFYLPMKRGKEVKWVVDGFEESGKEMFWFWVKNKWNWWIIPLFP